MASTDDESQRTVLYRFYGADDQLLYVGITNKPGQRWEAHMRLQPWWPQVQRQTSEWHPNREAAADAEIVAIREEGPLHNRRHATSAGLNPLTLQTAWTCTACGWTTEDPVEQVEHMEREVKRLTKGPLQEVERLSRAVVRMRNALDRLAVSSAQALTMFDQMAAPPPRKPREAPHPMSAAEVQKLLADLDHVLDADRVRLAELPHLLRRHDPTWVPYRKLTGVRLQAALKRCGIRITNTGNVRRLDPADLRLGRKTAA